MADSDQQTNETTTASAALPDTSGRIVKKFGGRHLIFRASPGKVRLLPKPYVLISSFRGPVWVFYGLGQVWLTHKKLDEVGGWMVRAPRFRSAEVTAITEALDVDLEEFINYCNEKGIEGTILIEQQLIEFHWTFGFELEEEKLKEQNAESLDSMFQELTERYVEVKRRLGL